MNVRERHETQCHVESGVFIVPLIVMVIYIYIYKTQLHTLTLYDFTKCYENDFT